MLNNIATIINCIAIIVASIATIYGINSWKKESKWKKKNELAEELLYLLYECRDGISRMRSPLGWSNEGKTRKQNPDESPELKDSLDKAYVLNERYDNNKELFNKLFSLRYRVLIYFGDDVEKSISTIYKVTRKLFISADLLGRYYWPKLGRAMDEKRLNELTKNINEHEKVFWIMSEDDEITKDVTKAIENAEKVLKKWIR
jgi:hypothetical protein